MRYFALSLCLGLTGCATPRPSAQEDQVLKVQEFLATAPEQTRFVTLRLFPGADVRQTLTRWAQDQHIKAAFVASAVGSLKVIALRFADQQDTFVKTAKYEIVALSGLLSSEGVHLHLAAADGKGQTLGGHLQEGSLVYTTLEVVLGLPDGTQYQRRQDSRTGYRELFFGL